MEKDEDFTQEEWDELVRRYEEAKLASAEGKEMPCGCTEWRGERYFTRLECPEHGWETWD